MEYFILNSRGLPVIEPDARVWDLWHRADPRRHMLCTDWEVEDGLVIVETCFQGFDLRPSEQRGDGHPVLWDTAATLYPNDPPGRRGVHLGLWWWDSDTAARMGHEQAVHDIQMEWGGDERGGNGSA